MDENNSVVVKCKGGGSIIDKTPLFSPDGENLCVILQNIVRSYNVLTGERVRDYEGCDERIVAVFFDLYDNQNLVACSEKGEVLTWKWKSGIQIRKQQLDVSEPIVMAKGLPNKMSDTEGFDLLIVWSNLRKYRANVQIFSSADGKQKGNLFSLQNEPFDIDISIDTNPQYVAAVQENILTVVNLKNRNILTFKTDKRRKFTCVACHPTNVSVATGDVTGRIVLWHDIFSSNKPPQTIYHWHTLPANTVAFSQSGTHFYSGAGECVMVKWQVDNPRNRIYLPRLPGTIVHLSVAPENLHVAISTNDNGIQLVDAQNKIVSVIQHLTWGAPFFAGLTVDGRTKALVLNGRVGHIQFYRPHNSTLLYNLDIVCQNKLTDERGITIINTDVTRLALSKNSDWLATVEERFDEETSPEIRLKFWLFDASKQMYCLNTSIDLPHETGVNRIMFQPSETNMLCVTVGNDCKFKVWSLMDSDNIYRKSKLWNCIGVGYYRDLEARGISFSTDGSLLAVGFDSSLTAWLPESCQLKCALSHSDHHEPIQHVQFGNIDQSHLVVVASSKHIYVWNLLTLSVLWTVPTRITALCADLKSTLMAAFTEDSNLFIFAPNSSEPEYVKKHVSQGKVLAAAFVPRMIPYRTGVSWLQHSQLYFVNSNQELLCVQNSEEDVEEAALEYSVEQIHTPFSALIAQESVNAVDKQGLIKHMDVGLTDSLNVTQTCNM